jgi:hypothetical protein
MYLREIVVLVSKYSCSVQRRGILIQVIKSQVCEDNCRTTQQMPHVVIVESKKEASTVESTGYMDWRQSIVLVLHEKYTCRNLFNINFVSSKETNRNLRHMQCSKTQKQLTSKEVLLC